AHAAQGGWYIAHGIARLPRGDRDDFDTVEGQHAHDDGHPYTAEAVRHEAARQPREILRADRVPTEAEHERGAEDDEGDDRHHLDQGKPVFDRAEVVDRA